MPSFFQKILLRFVRRTSRSPNARLMSVSVFGITKRFGGPFGGMSAMYHSRHVPASWESVEAIYSATIRELLPRRIDPSTPWFAPALAFELARLDEGRPIGRA